MHRPQREDMHLQMKPMPMVSNRSSRSERDKHHLFRGTCMMESCRRRREMDSSSNAFLSQVLLCLVLCIEALRSMTGMPRYLEKLGIATSKGCNYCSRKGWWTYVVPDCYCKYVQTSTHIYILIMSPPSPLSPPTHTCINFPTETECRPS